VDSTAHKAIRNLVAGMQGGLTSPARPWFKLVLEDKSLQEFQPVKEWLWTTQGAMYDAFRASNFYSSVQALYTELAAFGTGAIYQEEHPRYGMVFKVFTTGSYWIGSDDRGVCDSLIRELFMPARNIVKRWGTENVSQATKNTATQQPDKLLKVLHAMYPRDDYNPDMLDRSNMPVEDLFWEDGTDGESLLEIGGYREFPVFVPRWDVTAEDVWGQGPGFDALPDAGQVNQQVKSKLMALHKANTPPMGKPASMKDRLDLRPGGENVVHDIGTTQSVKPLYEVSLNALAMMVEDIRETQKNIRDWFFYDIFLMASLADKNNVTATEILKRNEEQMILLGPVIERQQYEFLDPLIDRTFNLMWRAGKIPPPPAELDGARIDVDYVSLLAQAQKMVGTRAIEATVNFAGGLAQVKPDILDVIDADDMLRDYAEMQGVPPTGIVSREDVDKVRTARAEEQARMQQIAEQKAESETMRNMAKADMSKDNALSRTMGAA